MRWYRQRERMTKHRENKSAIFQWIFPENKILRKQNLENNEG